MAAVLAHLSSLLGGAPIQEFANVTLSPEQTKQRAAALLNNKALLRKVKAVTLEDQTKFIDKVDQVCRSGRFSSLDASLFLSRHFQPSTRNMQNS